MRYIVETIRYLKGKNFPRGKLKGLQDAIFQSRNQSLLEGLAFLRHIQGENLKKKFMGFPTYFTTNQQTSSFPWFKEDDYYYTPFLDLIELYDFIE